MPKLMAYSTRFRRGQGWTALFRARLPSGSYITPDTISTVNCKVQYQDGTETYDTNLTVANVVKSDLVTDDARWTKDSTGYNFLHEVPASAFDAAGYVCVEFMFTPVAGQTFIVAYNGPVFSKLT